MDETYIEGVILTPLNKICHPKGDILHGMKKCDEGFTGFGEAYFSTINNGEIKGWNRHKKMTLNLIVPVGEVTFVIYDDREKSKTKGIFYKIDLSPSNYKRLTVPPGLWFGFRGISEGMNFICNVADIPHDPDEVLRKELNEIEWSLV